MTDNKRLNTRRQRELELDEEIAELEKQFVQQPEDEGDEPTPPEPKNVEEESWKQRYSDLRSFAQKKENDLLRDQAAKDKRIAELEKQLQDDSSGLPQRADAASIREWMAEFPDVAAIVLGIVEERQEARETEVNKKLDALERDRIQLAQDKARQKVNEAHKDFPQLVNSEDFQRWVADHAAKAEQGNRFSAAIVEALWGDTWDADAAIEAVNRYKQEKSTPKRTPKDDEADAVASVRGSRTREPTVQGNKPVFKESQIEKMSHREYDKYEKDIEEARLEGRIVYDLSGAAR